MQQRRKPRDMYYIDGSTVRKYDDYGSQPVRRQAPERKVRPQKPMSPERRRAIEIERAHKRKMQKKAAESVAFNFKYTAFLITMAVIMVISCSLMLMMQQKINKQKKEVRALQSELQAMNEDNIAYEDSLTNMYTVDDIYTIATKQLGMVYAKKGQIVYYDSANEDYVNQYKDVPETQ